MDIDQPADDTGEHLRAVDLAAEPQWIGTAEAARILGCTPRTASRAAAAGADEWDRTGQRPDPGLWLVAKRVGARGTFVIDQADAEVYAASETWAARLRHQSGRYPRPTAEAA
jgi:hypothetical protein